MPALKLFISHSSRLDDADPPCADTQSNWEMLKATRDKLQAHYGDRIEILVDLDLQAADHWEARLNEWLYECHAAIILFSKRAIETSNWVKKESTILAWRRQFDASLKLIPVTLKDQTTAADLATDYYGTLGITDSQCVRDAACADDILAGVIQALGEPESLANNETPFDSLVNAVTGIITKEADAQALENLWHKITNTPAPITGHPDRARRYAQALARHLLRDCQQALDRFQDLLDGLSPRPLQERAEELLKTIRALWVDAGAAGLLPAARAHGEFLAMSGELVATPEPTLATQCFTLDRYLERAWPGTDKIKIIPVTRSDDPDEVRNEIRTRFRPGARTMPPHRIDNAINASNCQIVVLVPAPECDLDPTQLAALRAMQTHYPRLIYVLATGAALPTYLPQHVRPVLPAVEPDLEWTQHDKEIEARELIDKKYGAHP
jgi:hypothetical protein